MFSLMLLNIAPPKVRNEYDSQPVERSENSNDPSGLQVRIEHSRPVFRFEIWRRKQPSAFDRHAILIDQTSLNGRGRQQSDCDGICFLAVKIDIEDFAQLPLAVNDLDRSRFVW